MNLPLVLHFLTWSQGRIGFGGPQRGHGEATGDVRLLDGLSSCLAHLG